MLLNSSASVPRADEYNSMSVKELKALFKRLVWPYHGNYLKSDYVRDIKAGKLLR